MYVAEMAVSTTYRLNGGHTIIGSGLIAILQAFSYVVKSDWLRGRKGVVCADSKTALYLIRNNIDPKYKSLAFEVVSIRANPWLWARTLKEKREYSRN